MQTKVADTSAVSKKKRVSVKKGKGAAQQVTTTEQQATSYSSIKAGPEIVNTVLGDIHEWLPIPENLPNHPTLVRQFIFLQ